MKVIQRWGISLLALTALFLFGCDKTPEPPKKPVRYMAETQKTQTKPPYTVTIWNQNQGVSVGSNVFSLEFLAPDKTPTDPGAISIQPVLEDQGKEPTPGQAFTKPTETPGLFNLFAELPVPGRWRFNVIVGGQPIKFYYTARSPETPTGKQRSTK